MIASFICFLWLFPVIYFVFGAEDVWWVLTLMSIAIMIIRLAKLEWVVDKTNIDKDMKHNEVFYYMYDYNSDKGGDK
jgi:cytosine/uracil/thiamine/allantoin permease